MVAVLVDNGSVSRLRRSENVPHHPSAAKKLMIARTVRDKTPRMMRGKSHGRKKAIFAASLHNIAYLQLKRRA